MPAPALMLLLMAALWPMPALAQSNQDADDSGPAVIQATPVGGHSTPAAPPKSADPPGESAGQPKPDDAAAKPADSAKPPGAEAKPDKPVAKPAPYRTRSASAAPSPEPPEYVTTLDKLGEEYKVLGLKGLDWLEFGVEQRTRFEQRDDFYRAALQTNNSYLMRSRAYLGVKKILDPFRFGVEFQDSREFNSELPANNGDVDEAEILQLFGELYFKDALGKDEPFRFQFGRMSFDLVDRRLIARNRFRNTTNAFDGFRIRIGETKSPWELNFLAAQPVDRRLTSFDHPDEERWLYALTGSWRGWSPHIILEPYYIILDEDRKGFPSPNPDREIHTLGLHGYGLIGKTGFDYDFDVAFQFGESGATDHRAFASHSEIGYTFDHPWKPRVAVQVDYASGDRTPGDSLSERFDSLFGAAHAFYGYADLVNWRNIIEPALFVIVRPTGKLTIDAYYRAIWLASDSDAWVVPNRRDSTGTSGDFVGQEIDVRMRYQILEQFEIEIGYAHFMPGDFVINTGPPTDDSDFFYVQTTLGF